MAHSIGRTSLGVLPITFVNNLLRIGEHKAGLGLLEHWHVRCWVLLDEDGLALGAHVAVDFIRNFHLECLFAENTKM